MHQRMNDSPVTIPPGTHMKASGWLSRIPGWLGALLFVGVNLAGIAVHYWLSELLGLNR